MSHISRSNKPRRADRQVQAQVRKDLAAKRSPAEQLARLDAARLDAVRERAKLKARMKASAPAEKPSETQPAARQDAPKGKKARKAAAAANAS